MEKWENRTPRGLGERQVHRRMGEESLVGKIPYIAALYGVKETVTGEQMSASQEMERRNKKNGGMKKEGRSRDRKNNVEGSQGT